MRYEILLDQFYDGVRIRQKGDVIDFDGILSPKVAKPLDQPTAEKLVEEQPRHTRRARNTH